MGKDRILRHLHDVAEGPWEYGNGDPMSSDAQDFILAYEHQAQTIKELQAELQAKTEECDGLRAQVNELVKAFKSLVNVQREKFSQSLEGREYLDYVDDLMANNYQQSLSSIRNEAIREGWDMCMDKVLHHLNQWTHSTGKMALQSVKQIQYPQLTEENGDEPRHNSNAIKASD